MRGRYDRVPSSGSFGEIEGSLLDGGFGIEPPPSVPPAAGAGGPVLSTAPVPPQPALSGNTPAFVGHPREPACRVVCRATSTRALASATASAAPPQPQFVYYPQGVTPTPNHMVMARPNGNPARALSFDTIQPAGHAYLHKTLRLLGAYRPKFVMHKNHLVRRGCINAFSRTMCSISLPKGVFGSVPGEANGSMSLGVPNPHMNYAPHLWHRLEPAGVEGLPYCGPPEV